MKLDRTLLIIGLVALPASLAFAQNPDIHVKPPPMPDILDVMGRNAVGGASSITLKVPVEATRIPAEVRQVVVLCSVGVGPVSGDTTWTRETSVGGGSTTITLPTSAKIRTYRGTASVEIATTNPARAMKEATHYSCRLTGVAGQPGITGDGPVTGAIQKP
jgi:hypothetical protein